MFRPDPYNDMTDEEFAAVLPGSGRLEIGDRCWVCGERTSEGDVAEVVLKADPTNTHHLVHAESCYNEEEMELA